MGHVLTPWQVAWRLGAGLFLTAIGSWAEAAEFPTNYGNADTRRWSCRLCEFDKAAQTGTITTGAMQSSGSHMRFGRDNGMDESGGYLNLNADYRWTTPSDFHMELTGRNLGLDSRDAALRLEKRRLYGVRARYRETPRNQSDDGRSPYFDMVGPRLPDLSRLRLPDDWVPAFNTAAMTQLADSSKPVKLATKRRRSEFGVWLMPLPGVTVEAGYFNEQKRGVEETSRDFLYQATALPQPVDHRIEGADTSLRYRNPTLSVAVSYANRQFKNARPVLQWDNPYIGLASQGRSAAAPSNKASTLSFVSRLRLHRTTHLSATLARGEAKQNEPFLPYTSNAALDLAPIDRSGLEGNRESLDASLNLVSRPTSRLRLSFAHRVVDRNDRRQALALTPVLGELFAPAPRATVGYDFKRANTDINLRYRLPGRSRLAAGFRNQVNERSNLEIARNEERRGWLELSREFGMGWRMNLRHARGDRDASEFLANTANNPLTRRYHQAARHESVWRGGLRFNSASGGLSVGFDANQRKFTFPDSPLDLQRERFTGWLADVAWTVDRTASLSGFYGVQRRQSTTAGTVAFPARDWFYDIEDRMKTAGARLTAKGFPHPALDLRVDYAHHDGTGDYGTAVESANERFPGLISRHRSVDVRLQTAWRAKSRLELRYYYERYRAADWAIDGVGRDAIRNVLILGRSSAHYGNHLLALSLRRAL